nr:MAG: hypothetical protein [Bacteriophage sp.]
MITATSTTYYTEISVALSAAAVISDGVTTPQQLITVPAATSYFVRAPLVAIANLATGTVLGIARYIRSQSSSTNLTFSFVGVGAAVVAGNYSFSVIMMDTASSF